MAHNLSSYGELLSTSTVDLLKDVTMQRMLVRRMRLGIELKKEKDTARYQQEKRHLARMLTALKVLQEKGAKTGAVQPGAGTVELKSKPKTRKVSASAPRVSPTAKTRRGKAAAGDTAADTSASTPST